MEATPKAGGYGLGKDLLGEPNWLMIWKPAAARRQTTPKLPPALIPPKLPQSFRIPDTALKLPIP